MKKIINIIVLALSVFSLFSCQDFLKEESKSQMTLDYYYTDKGLKEGVAAVYSSCREMFRQNMFEVNYFSDLSELAASQNNTYDHVGKVSVGFLNALFADMHQGIMIINRMERVIGDNPETRTKEIYLAELRGFRAMFYQYQVELWGKYGHYQETVYDQYEESMLYLNQKPVSFYYEQILKDIDYAIEKLPTQSEIKEFGRLSQGAAKALKARFCWLLPGILILNMQAMRNIIYVLNLASPLKMICMFRRVLWQEVLSMITIIHCSPLMVIILMKASR